MTHSLPLKVFSKTSVIAIFVFILTACSTFPDGPISTVNTDEGIAIKGYDPVAYFTDGKPARGKETITSQWEGVTYRFASEENRREFEANPERYIPQYGGYCAYAIAIDRIADIDPEEWAIVDDKLYLNANVLAQTLWDTDRNGNIESGDKHWSTYPKSESAPPINTSSAE